MEIVLVLGQLLDEFALERLPVERIPRLELVEHAALERQLIGDELVHALLDRGQVVGAELLVEVDVVVEAVLDRGADAEPSRRDRAA